MLVPVNFLGTGDAAPVFGVPGTRPIPDTSGEDALNTVAWTPDGSTVVASNFDARIDVVTVADGQRRTLIEDGVAPVLSPDGAQIAYMRHFEHPEGGEIWVAGVDGSDPRRVTISLTPPTWAPDGSVLLASDPDGWFTVRPDGTDKTIITPYIDHGDGGPQTGGSFPYTAWDGKYPGLSWQALPPE
jgi:hypothetical protein